ncbi:MAG: hypothetical protein WCJ81_02295 [bacterium]
MVIIQHILLFFLVFISPLFPPVIIPFTYSLLALLLVQSVDPRTLSIISVAGSTLSCMVTWFIWDEVIKKTDRYQEKYPNSIWSKIIIKIKHFLSSQTGINKYTEKIERYAKSPHGKIIFILIVIFLVQSSIPDIIAIKLLRKKVSFLFFSITAAIGKVIVYVPFIFLGMTALAYIKQFF